MNGRRRPGSVGESNDKDQRGRRGGVAEGVGFSPTDKYLCTANYFDGNISILRVEGALFIDIGKRVALPGCPAAMRMVPG